MWWVELSLSLSLSLPSPSHSSPSSLSSSFPLPPERKDLITWYLPFTHHTTTQDITNHVIDDLESFMLRIRSTTYAWNELEKIKGQKSRRKKQAGIL